MIVEIKAVRKTYQTPDGEIAALRDVTFGVKEGEFLSIVGPSGCGKSTLLAIIAGLEAPSGGEICIEGVRLQGVSRKIGYMPQQDQLFPWRTIWDNVTLGLEVQRQKDEKHRRFARELLERYGLGQFADCMPSELSGGMRQRCALIRTLATGPRILLLDEPFSALDCQTRLKVADDIHAIIKREGKTAILVTHDIAEAVSMSDRVVVMSRRPSTLKRVAELPEMAELTPMQRRDHPQFHCRFHEIWKELELSD
ncbi:MAG: ABC transporter ATP-binding protein [Clostridia bacterium]|nr:ABC transporter ATP-binding protein [Clostridia bacterium]